jgi:restriction endonuclease Mrr
VNSDSHQTPFRCPKCGAAIELVSELSEFDGEHAYYGLVAYCVARCGFELVTDDPWEGGDEEARRFAPRYAGRAHGSLTDLPFKTEPPLFEQANFARSCQAIAVEFDQITRELVEYFSRNSRELVNLHHRRFEELLEAVSRNQGFRTELGSGWGDRGVDLRIYHKDSVGEILTLVQAKRYGPGNPIRLDAVAALWAMVEHEHANRGLFVTTSRYLPSVRKFAGTLPHRIVLADAEDVANWCARALPHMAG